MLCFLLFWSVLRVSNQLRRRWIVQSVWFLYNEWLMQNLSAPRMHRPITHTIYGKRFCTCTQYLWYCANWANKFNKFCRTSVFNINRRRRQNHYFSLTTLLTFDVSFNRNYLAQLIHCEKDICHIPFCAESVATKTKVLCDFIKLEKI